MLLAEPPPALYWWLTRRGCCCGDQGGRNLRPRRDRRRFGVRSAAFSPPPAPAGRPHPPARNGFRFLRLHGRWAGSDRCGGAPSVPAHGAIVKGCCLTCLVCLVQVDEVGGGDLRRMADFSGAPHPDMEGAAALQRPGGVLLPAVLPGWALGRAWARWRADRGTDAGRRRSAFRPRRCHPTCCPHPPVPVPVRYTGSWAAQRPAQAANRRLRCPDGSDEASWCVHNGMAFVLCVLLPRQPVLRLAPAATS